MGHRSQKMTDLKVLICGDGAIGKTCLLDTICEKDVIDWESPEYKPTAADNLSRQWSDEDGNDWQVNLWDTAGQEALVNLRRSAYPNTEVLLIGFDMTKGVSLDNIPSWVAEVAETEESIQATAFVCTSAKNGYGLLKEAVDGAAVDAEGDTMSGQGEQYLDLQILRCGKAVKNGDPIAALESRKPAPPAPAPAPAPAKEEKAAPAPPKQAEPEKPKQAPAAPAKPAAKKEDGGCCTLL